MQVLTLVGSNIILFTWERTKSNADHIELERWTKDMLQAIQQETQDFHGRLCSIEQKNKDG